MGQIESSPEIEITEKDAVLVDQREYVVRVPRADGQSVQPRQPSFLFFVNSLFAHTRSTRRHVIIQALRKYVYVADESQILVEFLELPRADPLPHSAGASSTSAAGGDYSSVSGGSTASAALDALPGLTVFRVRYGEKLFAGVIEYIDLAHLKLRREDAKDASPHTANEVGECGDSGVPSPLGSSAVEERDREESAKRVDSADDTAASSSAGEGDGGEGGDSGQDESHGHEPKSHSNEGDGKACKEKQLPKESGDEAIGGEQDTDAQTSAASGDDRPDDGSIISRFFITVADTSLLANLREFLKQRWCDEALEFWLDVRAFQDCVAHVREGESGPLPTVSAVAEASALKMVRSPSRGALEEPSASQEEGSSSTKDEERDDEDVDQLRQIALDIYNIYLRPEAPREIPVDDMELRLSVRRALEEEHWSQLEMEEKKMLFESLYDRAFRIIIDAQFSKYELWNATKKKETSRLESAAVPSSSSSSVPVGLQPFQRGHNVTFTCLGLEFDTEKSMSVAIQHLFRIRQLVSATEGQSMEQVFDEPDNRTVAEALLEQWGKNLLEVGEDLKHVGEELREGKIGALDLKSVGSELREGRIGRLDLGKVFGKKRDRPAAPESYEEVEEERGDVPLYGQNEDDDADGDEEEADMTDLVDAAMVARVIGYLEKPWDDLLPNTPVVTGADLKSVLEDWITYTQRYYIKLKWLEHVTLPYFLPAHIVAADKAAAGLDDADGKMRGVEFWNHPSRNFRSTSETSDIPLWRTRVLLHRSNETGDVSVVHTSSVPIWHVVDQEKDEQLCEAPPASLFVASLNATVRAYDQLSYGGGEDISRFRSLVVGLPLHVQRKLLHTVIRRAVVRENPVSMTGLAGGLVVNEVSLGECGVQVSTPNMHKVTSVMDTILNGLHVLAPQLTALNVSSCNISNGALSAFASSAPMIQTLDISNCSTFYQWDFLLHLDHLRRFSLSHVVGNSQLWSRLCGLHHLIALDMSYSRIELEDLNSRIKMLSTLQELDIRQDPMQCTWKTNDEALLNISNLTDLRVLKLMGSDQVSVSGMLHLGKLTSLTELYISHLVGESKHAPIVQLTSLQRLALVDSEIEETTMVGLCALPVLEALDVSRNNVSGDALLLLRGKSTLTELDVSFNEIGLDRFRDHQCIAQLTQLRCLTLNGNPLIAARPWLQGSHATEHVEAMARLGSLTSLELEGCGEGLEDSGVYHLRTMTQLTRLNLRNNSLTDNAFVALRRLEKLTYLDVSANQITTEVGKMLLSFRQLRHLNLSRNPVSDSLLYYLVQLPSIEHLEIRGARVTHSAIDMMAEHSPHINLLLV